MNVFLLESYHSKQVNDLLCSYNLVSCGGLSKTDIISAIQNSFANMRVSFLSIMFSCFMSAVMVNKRKPIFVRPILVYSAR